jgi:hypothetical protein
MEEIKEAFNKVKKDISFLGEEIISIKKELFETRNRMIELCEIISNLSKKKEKIENEKYILNIPDYYKSINIDTSLDDKTHISTENKGVETNSTNNSTHQFNIKALNDQIYYISTGNKGVQTDRQTDRQTDKKQEKSSYNQKNDNIIESNESSKSTKNLEVDSVLDTLNSLDNLKKEIRLKFKRLTDQELLVFSTIYQQEEELGYSDYKSLSKKLNLSESSIRDYVSRLISKNIPLNKNKINNKGIRLSISPSLKKITSLDTIIRLRDL